VTARAERLEAAGLALFCVTGASTALDHHVGTVEAVVLGSITGVGGGVLRDVLVLEIPVVLRTGLYAIPALIGAAVCFLIRLAGVYFDLNVPRAPGRGDRDAR
jgi:uncharacterized membrane protein YeiH